MSKDQSSFPVFLPYLSSFSPVYLSCSSHVTKYKLYDKNPLLYLSFHCASFFHPFDSHCNCKTVSKRVAPPTAKLNVSRWGTFFLSTLLIAHSTGLALGESNQGSSLHYIPHYILRVQWNSNILREKNSLGKS